MIDLSAHMYSIDIHQSTLFQKTRQDDGRVQQYAVCLVANRVLSYCFMLEPTLQARRAASMIGL